MAVEAIENWARWRIYRAGNELGWPKRDSIGRAMSGMPSTKCIVCNGKGRIVEHDAYGRDIRIECKICAGQGKLAMDPDPHKANPAFIHATRGRNSYDDDPVSQKIDFIVCTELTEPEQAILTMEYTRVGNQNQKLHRLKKEDEISLTHSLYNQMLIEAENKVLDHLTL